MKAGLQNGGRDGWKPSLLGGEWYEEGESGRGAAGDRAGRPTVERWGGGYLRDWVAMAL